MEPNGKMYEQDVETQSLLQFRHKDHEWRQYLAAMTACIISMAVGCSLGWSSYALPLLMSGQGEDLGGIESISSEEASWISSLLTLGSLTSALPAGQLCSCYGRRKFLLILGLLQIISWALITWNGNRIGFLYFGRFLNGFVAGSICVPLPMYTNEISSDLIRGRSGVIYDTMQVFGILFVYSVNAMMTLFWTSITCLTIPVIFVCVFYWMPESPLYLVKKGRQAEAVKSIKWLHGEDCNIENELIKIRLALLEGKKCALEDDKESSTYWESMEKFFNNLNKTVFKSFAIIFFLFIVQRSCGASIVVVYSVDVFQATHSKVSPQTAAVLAGVSQLIFSIISIFLVDRSGRIILLRISLLVMTLCSAAYVTYTILLSKGYTIVDDFDWIPVLAVCLFAGIFRLGLGPIPWFLGAELVPTEAQKWALPTIYFIGWAVAFFWVKSYLEIVALYGHATMFAIFTIVCFLGLLHTLTIPETKHKSRIEIQEALGASILSVDLDRISNNSFAMKTRTRKI